MKMRKGEKKVINIREFKTSWYLQVWTGVFTG